MAGKKVLMVLTSNDKLGESGEQTGWYLTELAHPYEVFHKAGVEMTFASPNGGVAPIDASSVEASAEDTVAMAFWNNPELKKLTETTVKLADVDAKAFDAVFVVGGFGVMWDLPEDKNLHEIVRTIWEKQGVVSAVCHGPAALTGVTLADGSLLVKDKNVAGFTNDEEDTVKRREIVPWTIEDRMTANGAKYTKGDVFKPHVAVDGKLVTGQNPPSATPTAEAVLKALTEA